MSAAKPSGKMVSIRRVKKHPPEIRQSDGENFTFGLMKFLQYVIERTP
jgi:hypothetical protein